MNRKIKKVAVLGSGVMGSRIACHFANIGLDVLLLDIVPRELNEKEQAKGLSLEHPAVRNRIVNDSLTFALKSNPSPIYDKAFAKRIKTGNFDDDFSKIKDADWIIEVVIERLDIKQQIFEKVDALRKPGALVTSNTSGIPIAMMSEGRSDDFQKHFCGTHFFNPPRYLKLFEVIPGPKTDQSVLDFFMHYGDLYLGKTTVLCKDTPAFIANRVGVFSMMAIMHTMNEMGLTPKQVDSLTGPLTGRPKSATFRTADVVGIDTLAKVAKGVADNCPNDESKDLFVLPDYIHKMIENKWLGSKTKQGFFKKVKDETGKSQILGLDLNDLEYKPIEKTNFPTVAMAKPIDDLKERLVAINKGQDKAAEFLKKVNMLVFKYVSFRIPEISDELYRIDEAIKAGFGWELGPFEIWDTLGVERMTAKMKEAGLAPAEWVDAFLAAGHSSFYKTENGQKVYYDIPSKTYKSIPGAEAFIILDNLREQAPVWKNSGTILHDIGDGVLNLEFRTKMNAIGGEVIEGINKSIELAEQEGWKGLVIGNDAANFSAGANLAMILMTAAEQEYDELNFMIKAFQDTMMRVRYSSIPVVTAPHGLALGGGCEMSMHADKVQASAETYTGLVEFGVGLLPAGGGTKETTKRVAESIGEGDVVINKLREAFVNIATAKVATSAYEAMNMGLFRKGIDEVTLNQDRLIADAKASVLELYNAGYTMPTPAMVKVQGRSALGTLMVGTHAFRLGNYASDHDRLIADKIAYVMCGGDLTMPQEVSEQYLLDLEREAFLSLCGTQKTLERIQHMLQKGKPLRN
ncbi:MAG: enoyl-CoA hydratase/isomerase family protein [Saprospiraceae bacterium]|nr:enoyl-CoA hydratase/isomerase family protein [Saprospiraceae bacterium]